MITIYPIMAMEFSRSATPLMEGLLIFIITSIFSNSYFISVAVY